MKPFFKCELEYSCFPHLNQIYDGFNKLSEKGIIDLSVKYSTSASSSLKVLVDGKYTVFFDTADGLSWIPASIEENLKYFKNNIKADFYFKRSFNQLITDNAPDNCKVFPLGLNYLITPQKYLDTNLKRKIKFFVKKNIKKAKNNRFYSNDFEFYPVRHKTNKILFLTRLWDPNEVSLEHLKQERELINKNRINFIKSCKAEFGDNFIGGIQYDNFSKKNGKDLLMPSSMTNKRNFMQTVKESNICISTKGLHDSIGWKFAEYVAASRAIITEPLSYELPGDFNNNENYSTFKSTNDLMTNISELLGDNNKMENMMYNNYEYYNNYLRSDKLVLNALLKIYE
ncbi:hypothetical protein [Tenacibaculum finnmarkense]|uniref:hypothetical protein n=1 Tax=Tenacibaculum finnmarkense TaxID=2781243 RepID=UPI000C672898|nr:hypothetical protein [Tenacibaculum finnmarkense]MCG8769884.1 glycosyltransferase family 1 protein [Tenacibaculum finnmarkense]MCG8871943.1 glycosyltransferase family 1 protein [Tenacibaculum finnmarkense]SOS51392.1 conserved hypothetical protein [Tenacibaculum finnmarkense]